MSHTPPSSSYPHSTGYSTSMAERNDLHDMSPEELEIECQHLRDENHQLQLRILGVNELARLLQDRSEMVQVLEEKNKRLEIAVVRLENRCANMDRTLKSQKVRGMEEWLGRERERERGRGGGERGRESETYYKTVSLHPGCQCAHGKAGSVSIHPWTVETDS